MTRYVYGPVQSRRLGSSLGVDIVPMKTCTLNCVYCQLGGGFKTVTRRSVYVPSETIIAQVKDRLQGGAKADFVTLGGSGEPTLNTDLGRIVSGIQALTDIPLCLITNGSLMWMEEVRDQCKDVDLIMPSLDACDESSFQAVNRPDGSLSFEKIVQGLVDLRHEYKGMIWLEIFLVPGLNDSISHFRRFRELTARIMPDRVHLNTAVRPPAESFVRPVPYEKIEELCDCLGGEAEPIVAREDVEPGTAAAGDADIIAFLQRRPCTAAEVAEACGLGEDEAVNKLKVLRDRAQIRAVHRDGATYYTGGKGEGEYS